NSRISAILYDESLQFLFNKKNNAIQVDNVVRIGEFANLLAKQKVLENVLYHFDQVLRQYFYAIVHDLNFPCFLPLNDAPIFDPLHLLVNKMVKTGFPLARLHIQD